MTASSRFHGEYPDGLWSVLVLVWERGLTTQGDWARALAPEVALAASCGFISNITPDGASYSNRWRITASGLLALERKDFFTCSSS